MTTAYEALTKLVVLLT